jgi:CheY-like chemotaxis protein
VRVVVNRPNQSAAFGNPHATPAASSVSNVAESGEPATGAADRPYRHVLLVEDEPVLRRVLARNLTGRGLDVREAGTAAAALAEVASEKPDLLLLDINLPDRSGWDVMREMNRCGTGVPTIVVSAVRVSQSRMDEFHPLAYLPKPFTIEALLRLVFKTPEPDNES